MPTDARNRLLAHIRANIQRWGYHINLVGPGTVPRFAYTVELTGPRGADLVLAGCAAIHDSEVKRVIDAVAALAPRAMGAKSTIEGLGTFHLRAVHETWIDLLMRSAVAIAAPTQINALQIVPDGAHYTMDIPDLSVPWTARPDSVWTWLNAPWTLPIPRSSIAITNMDALRGGAVTELTRWEEDQWEMFAGHGPDTPREQMREVPISVMLAADPSLGRLMSLAVGKGLWREGPDSEWKDWG